ncbi:MAG: serine/threonine protein phosphatase [Betaproteobacteria bacterium]|nr:serine/threonine protein phosphatase [Betaproteobacteria bacterium]
MKPQTPADTVVYAIGDIHGRLDLLEKIQQRIANDAMQRAASRRQLVYLGDYVSRGPDSAGVVDRVRAWLPEGFERITLKGNHEDLLLRFIDGEIVTGRHWLDYGGLEAMAAYGVAIADLEARDDASVIAMHADLVARIPAAHLDFFRTLQISHRAGDYFFVHGGVKPGVPLPKQSDRDCMWIRKAFLNSNAEHGAMVVHGHSISEQPEIRRNRIGIDTGAYRSGVLTCLVLDGETRSFLQTASS